MVLLEGATKETIVQPIEQLHDYACMLKGGRIHSDEMIWLVSSSFSKVFPSSCMHEVQIGDAS